MNPNAKWYLGIGLLVLVAAAVVAGVRFDVGERVRELVQSVADPRRFAVLLAILPAVGAPISPFLVSAGAVFGTGPGLAVVLLAMPIHLAVAILAARAIRGPLRNFLERREISVPSVEPAREGIYSVIFLATPGPPYAAKNVLLPLAGFRLRHCFFTNWAVQGLLCLPLVLLGASASEGRFGLVAGALAAFLAVVLLGRHLRRRYPGGRRERRSEPPGRKSGKGGALPNSSGGNGGNPRW